MYQYFGSFELWGAWIKNEVKQLFNFHFPTFTRFHYNHKNQFTFHSKLLHIQLRQFNPKYLRVATNNSVNTCIGFYSANTPVLIRDICQLFPNLKHIEMQEQISNSRWCIGCLYKTWVAKLNLCYHAHF